jgi:HK97 family phage portal protein
VTWRTVFGESRSRDAPPTTEEALKVSAFYRAIDIRSDSIGKLPVSVRNMNTKQEVRNHHLGPVLWERPNEAMTPFVYKKVVEYQRLVLGKSYVWIYRDSRTGRPVELIPLPPGSCSPQIEPGTGKLWYIAADPKTRQLYKLDPADILHYKGFTTNGVDSVSLLAYAAKVLHVAAARETYEQAVYENGGHPSGVLMTDADLSGKRELVLSDGTKSSYKDQVRKEWERVHGGPGNAFRTAILDNGLKYQALNMSNTDAQFVESKAVTVADIARFTGVPLNLLYTGKESYASNEQNSLDYVKYTIQPTVTQYEEEDSRKLLTASEREAGLWLPRNMMAELRGDSASRVAWYKGMRELGAYSVNDVLEKEDMPPVPGGDTRYASLNYAPLEDWAELSRNRNTPKDSGAETKE